MTGPNPTARRRLRPGTHPDQLAPALAASLDQPPPRARFKPPIDLATPGVVVPGLGPELSADEMAEAGKDVEAFEAETAKTPAKPRTGKDTKAAANAATSAMFAGAPHQALRVEDMKIPDMQRGFQTLVNDLFEDGYDVMAEFKEVTEGLKITDALTPQRLLRAANVQEDLANRAHRLFIVGKIEVNAYIRETEGTYGAIREAAIQDLERAKATGSRTKQITDADAKAEAARLFPDQWADICTRRDKAEAMVLQLQNLAALAKSRCYTVSNMANPSARLSGG